jgi:hypothetical protein
MFIYIYIISILTYIYIYVEVTWYYLSLSLSLYSFICISLLYIYTLSLSRAFCALSLSSREEDRDHGLTGVQISNRSTRLGIYILIPYHTNFNNDINQYHILVMNMSVAGQVTFCIYQDDAPYTTVGLLNNNVMIFVV